MPKSSGVFACSAESRRRYAEVGDIIIASVQVAEPRKPIKKKDIIHALVVRQRKAIHRADGTYVRFDENAVVIIDKDKKTRRRPASSALFRER